MNRSTPFSLAFFLLVALGATPGSAQIAKGASKFVGNVYMDGMSGVRFDTVWPKAKFDAYWNRITPENAAYWSSVESVRGQMHWGRLDSISSYAKRHGIPWVYSPLLESETGFTSGMLSASPDTLKMQIQGWFDTVAARYPEISEVVVVDGPYPTHGTKGKFSQALAGVLTADPAWIVEAFRMARRSFPRARLLLSDYNNIEYVQEHEYFLKTVRALQAVDAPLDGIGCQAHDAYKRPVEILRKYLDSLATTGLPITITQYEIAASNDSLQDSILQAQFPLFWNHPAVAGITYWGTVEGTTWRTGTGLMNADGTERPALTWLKKYVAAHPNPPTPIRPSTAARSRESRPSSIRTPLEIRELGGRLVVGIVRGGEFHSLASGRIR